MFGGCTTPKYLTDGVPSNIWGLYTPKIFDRWGSVKYLGGLQPPNISRKGFRQIFGGCTAPKYLTDGVPSNIWGVYSPQIFHGWGSVINRGGLIKKQHIVNCHVSKTDKETCKCGGNYGPPCSVKYLGAVHPQNI